MIIKKEKLVRPDTDTPFFHELEHHESSPVSQWKSIRKDSPDFVGKKIKLSIDKLTCEVTTIWRKRKGFNDSNNTVLTPIAQEIQSAASQAKIMYNQNAGIVSTESTIKKFLSEEEAAALLKKS